MEDSRQLAGYAGPGGDTSGAQVTFTVPDFTCAPDETSILLSAVFANRTDDTGAPVINGGGGVFFLCQAGQPSMRTALYDSTGKPADAGPVAVKDKIRVSYVSDPGGGMASAVLENITQGIVTATPFFDYIETKSFQVGYLALAPDGSTGGPVPAVGKVRMRPVVIDGKRIRNVSDVTQYRLVDRDGKPIFRATKIKKGGFKIKPVERVASTDGSGLHAARYET